MKIYQNDPVGLQKHNALNLPGMLVTGGRVGNGFTVTGSSPGAMIGQLAREMPTRLAGGTLAKFRYLQEPENILGHS